MTDRTRHEIDLIDSANKHMTYEKKKKTLEQLQDLLKNYSSDTLIDMIMKESQNNKK